MTAVLADPRVKDLRGLLSGIGDPAKALDAVAAYIGQQFTCDQVLISCGLPSGAININRGKDVIDKAGTAALSIGIKDNELLFNGEVISLPHFFSDVNRSRGGSQLLEYLRQKSVRSFCLLPIFREDALIGWIECRYLNRYRRWRREDVFILQRIADFCSSYIERIAGSSASERQEQFFRQVLESSPSVMLELDAQGTVKYVSAAIESLAGIAPSNLTNKAVSECFKEIFEETLPQHESEQLVRVIAGERATYEFFSTVRHAHSAVLSHCLFRCESFRPSEARTLIIITDLTSSTRFHKELDEARHRSSRLVRYGNLIMLRTDESARITDTLGNIESVTGLSAKEFMHSSGIWERILEPQDLLRLLRNMRSAREARSELSDEIKILNVKTKKTHWVLLKGVPLFSTQGVFLGWEGFGVDITERRIAQENMLRDHRRLEALYEVARALEVSVDPAVVALKGLRALIKATASDSGFVCFYDGSPGGLEVVAAEGLSQSYLEELSKLMNERSLVRMAVEQREGFLIDNLQEDPRAARDLARREGLQSAIVLPLISEGEIAGALVVFCRKAKRYSGADMDLVSAAATQICLAAKQAEYFSTEKRQANSLAVLYRLSHEVSKYHSTREIGEHAFPIIQKELHCRRMWLSIVNDQGSHLVGQAGFGPGMRQHMIDLQVSLSESPLMRELISSKQPLVLEESQLAQCSAHLKVIDKLEIKSLALIPMISLGRCIGVIVLEPLIASAALIRRKFGLFQNIANELATVIVARRFEAKMADADKMRMAGVLASGVAHNFNNLLQAVMGQASLIELQLPKDSPLTQSARTIIDAAARGGGLIKQLLTFSRQGIYERTVLSANKLIAESQEFYKSILGSGVELEIKLSDGAPDVFGDYSQLQQMITNLIANAREAVSNKQDAIVKISTADVQVRSGEIDPELPPGRYMRIDVEDNGVGMDEERRIKCFEPFFTTKDVDFRTGLGLKGSGLGLSSAYSIAKQHHGTVTVRSTLGQGTQFSIFIPESKGLIVSDEGKSEELSEQSVERRQLILFEPENSVAVSMGQIAESLHLHLVVAEGREKLRDVLTSPAAKDAVLVIQLERVGQDIISFIWDLQRGHEQLRILLLCRDRKRWLPSVGGIERVYTFEFPSSVWSLHSAVDRLLRGTPAVPQTLSAAIEIERMAKNGESLPADDSNSSTEEKVAEGGG